MLNYLYHFALPWLYLRRSIRANESAPIDLMWSMCFPWFRATKKTLYSTMAVDVVWTLESMSTALRSTWEKFRTISLRGNRGRNIALDKANEHMNNIIKTGLGSRVTRENIDPFILRMLGVCWITSKLKSVLGIGDNDKEDGATPQDGKPEYSGVLQSDVDHIAGLLKGRLGNTHNELFSANSTNPFKRGNGADPMNRVSGFVGLDREQYVREQFQSRQY